MSSPTGKPQRKSKFPRPSNSEKLRPKIRPMPEQIKFDSLASGEFSQSNRLSDLKPECLNFKLS
jgi:hypothetical protein